MIRCVGHVARMGKKNDRVEDPSRRRKDNIGMYLKEVDGVGMGYYDSVYGQVVGNESSKFIKCVEFVNMPHRTHNCTNTLYDYATTNY